MSAHNCNSEQKKKLRDWAVKRAGRRGLKCRFCECGLTKDTFTFDHKIPQSKGGTWERSNLIIACEPCNSQRGDMDFFEFIVFRNGGLRLKSRELDGDELQFDDKLKAAS